jgi:predicted nucleotidyltransferase
MKNSTSPESLPIPLDYKALVEFCRRHGIRKLSFFGSVLREDFGPDSDVDILVEFEAGKIVGFDILDMEEELSVLLGGHTVDMVNEKYLNHRLRPIILREALVQYAQG